ncbi:glycosyltransferase family 4 protein [Flavobacterium caseinilyticum]|uniref:Glycosyltransferase n=1 Tax=Flavobacterium caseinilyticum TaxID=2541732 RepID=A0A4R5AXQ5_9FLAO|nr:glycosyltransferase [Flavobacterium caseinilyticum]TDD75984.1 glycosyltransferase [Flavobacterium caseinilyticum]
MTFVIVTHVPHSIQQDRYFAYSPYVREMNIWGKYVDELIVVAPVNKISKTAIDSHYHHESIEFVVIENFNVISFKSSMAAILKIPKISWQIFKAMQKADHIHLRCPGNIGLLGCFIQILFPYTPKTAKYAGNWDPQSKQPWSYRLQKWILSNTFLTRSMQMLVYGEWENSSKNITQFFTATYSESEKLPLTVKNIKGKIQFVFVGTLVVGKNPLYAIQLVENLSNKGYNVHLDLFGEGEQRSLLEEYIQQNVLEKIITLNGNQAPERVKEAYRNSHFVVLPSKSEGWPKAIAEGMFWGCVPLATAVSCVPFMLDYGKRGILLEMKLEKDVAELESLLGNQSDFDNMRRKAADWSRNYTLDFFEQEIKGLLRQKKQIEQ